MEIKPVERTIGPATGTCLTGALARGSREPGQDLSVAAISGVLLCEGLWRAGAFQFLYVQHLLFSMFNILFSMMRAELLFQLWERLAFRLLFLAP